MRRLVPLTFLLLMAAQLLHAQDIPVRGQKRIVFPYPMDRKWAVSVGITATTLPLDITEEVRFRLPAGNIQVLRRLGGRHHLEGRLNFQVLQNLVLLGYHYTRPVSNRVSLGLGHDAGFWFGFINTSGIKTRGSGWQSYPSVSLGYRFNKRILVTARAEGMLNFGISTYANETKVASNYSVFSGTAYSVFIEQPFFKQKSLTLGFRAIYTDFFWQTWTLFDGTNRNVFYPQVIVGVIL
jgi:hypothetical protein